MFEKLLNRVQRFLDVNIFRSKKSYSQSGEDLIVRYVFKSMNFQRPSFLDIGANHPVFFNNTFLLYKHRSKGVCVEPNPLLAKGIRKRRSRDIVINKGIGIETNDKMKFFIFSSHTLSTFSNKDAEKYIALGEKLLQTTDIGIININELISDYFDGKSPDFISIDIEGWDLDILKSLNFQKYRPVVICAETLTYSTDKKEQKKNTELINYLLIKDYFLYADTYINSIFVDKKVYYNI